MAFLLSMHGIFINNACRFCYGAAAADKIHLWSHSLNSSSYPDLPLPNQKPTSSWIFDFGRTRRIRTADLCHVKADWPHQDTRVRGKAGAIREADQISSGRLLGH